MHVKKGKKGKVESGENWFTMASVRSDFQFSVEVGGDSTIGIY